MADKIIRIKQATKKGYIEMKSGGVCDVSYPESKLRRGRVQGGGDISPTLTCTGEAIVRIEILEDKRMEKAEETKTKDATEKYAIRKLTENETWRLMGFSDEDFNKAAKVNSRSQLYRQSGNSIVKQVLMAIFLQLGIQGKKRWNDMTVEERQKLVDSSLDFIEK